VDYVGEQNAMAKITQMMNTCFLHNLNKVLENVPIKRVGQPEDIASIVSYLASKEAHFITGWFMPSLRLSLAYVACDISRSMCRSI
jgi:NAD(P)-dependent dehydrogenase (short-subunit alcohol dehydrogenase family)